MNALIQPELFRPVETTESTQSRDRSVIRVSDHPWGILVCLTDLAWCFAGNSRLFALVCRELRALGKYKILTSINRGEKRISQLFPIDHTFKTAGNLEWLFLPKSKLAEVTRILNSHKSSTTRFERKTFPAVDLTTLGSPFVNGTTLDDFQYTNCELILKQAKSGIIDYSLAGGKTFVIAALARAYKDVRPLLITGTRSTDTTQLAVKLSAMLGEKIALIGSAGSIDKELRKSLFVKNWREASIVISTHRIYERVTPIVLGMPEKVDSDAFETSSLPGLFDKIKDDPENPEEADENSKDKEIDRFVSQAPFVIADEVHDLPTVNKIPHILGTNPTIFFGITGSWLFRSDLCDHILGDLVSEEGYSKTLLRVDHSQIVSTGRAAPVELSQYVFKEDAYPRHTYDGKRFKDPTLAQQFVETHDGLNRFCAELLNHLVHTNEIENRGTLIGFTKTIGHSIAILRHFCALNGLNFDRNSLRALGILIHNSKIDITSKLENISDLTDGKVRLILSTDAISTGFDSPAISDGIDMGGLIEAKDSIQRTGRPLRPHENKFFARWHTILYTHHPALLSTSRKKTEILESFYNCKATVFPADRLPWKNGPLAQLTDEIIAEELKNAGIKIRE